MRRSAILRYSETTVNHACEECSRLWRLWRDHGAATSEHAMLQKKLQLASLSRDIDDIAILRVIVERAAPAPPQHEAQHRGTFVAGGCRHIHDQPMAGPR